MVNRDPSDGVGRRARRLRGRTADRAPARLSEALVEETPENYPAFLADLKQVIRSARLQASISVNRELLLLYWHIGYEILTRQSREGWGTKVIDRLATDLRRAFPEMRGIS